MIATALEVTATTALVELRPCWVARLFGARTLVVELVMAGGSWQTSATHDLLSRCAARDRMILDALDYRPVASIPRCRLLP